jgi:hypothetical protein
MYIKLSSKTFNFVRSWFWETLAFIKNNLITARMLEVFQHSSKIQTSHGLGWMSTHPGIMVNTSVVRFSLSLSLFYENH